MPTTTLILLTSIQAANGLTVSKPSITPSTSPPADDPITESTDIDLLSILVVIAIFVVCIIVCTVLGCRNKSNQGGNEGEATSGAVGEEGLSLTGRCARRFLFNRSLVK